MGMDYHAFYNMTARVFQNKMRGWERQQRKEWYVARWLGSVYVMPYLKKGRRIQPTDLLKFPDEKTEAKAVNLENPDTRKIFREMIQKQGWNLPDELKN